MRTEMGRWLPGDSRSRDLDAIRISVTPETPELVRRIAVDLSGFQVNESDFDDVTEPDYGTAPPAEGGEQVTIEHVEIVGRPVYVEGVAVDLRLNLHNVAMVLVRDSGGDLWALEDPDRSREALAGDAYVSTAVDDVVAYAQRTVMAEAKEAGVTITSLEVDVRTPDPRRLVLQASARVRKGIFGAPVQLSLEASVNNDMIATVGDVRARSGNPIVGLVLAVIRGKLDSYTHRTYDLNEELPPWFRLVDLSLSGGDTIAVQARFG